MRTAQTVSNLADKFREISLPNLNIPSSLDTNELKFINKNYKNDISISNNNNSNSNFNIVKNSALDTDRSTKSNVSINTFKNTS
jgi:hypothetical protein